MRAHFNKGPAWAKTNLSADKIEQVRQLIELDETIAFRCRNPKPLPPGSVNTQPAPPVAAAAVPVKPRPKPKPVSAAADGAGDATPVAAPKPKPKPVAKAVWLLAAVVLAGLAWVWWPRANLPSTRWPA